MSATNGNNHSNRFRVRITAEDIEQGIRGNSGHCPIADAVKRVLNGMRVVVDLQTIRWTDNEKGIRYVCLTPRVAQAALLSIDQGKRPEPFAVNLYPFQTVPSGTILKENGRRKRRTAPKDVKPGRTYRAGSGSTAVRDIQVRGGKTPPVGALSSIGQKRTFGLRSAGMV